MFAHLLSIKEQLAVIVDDEIRPLLDLYVHFANGPAQGHLIDFRFTRSMWKRHMRAWQRLWKVVSQLLGVWYDHKQSAVSPQRSP